MSVHDAPVAMLSVLAEKFRAAGFQPVTPPHLYPAETLLELYGEDLRGRAFLFPGAGIGEELALRPDFTIPVVLHHGAQGWDTPRCYSYEGPVFRRQEPGSTRPIEYPQAGVESIGDTDRPKADAEVLKLLLDGLDTLGVTSRKIITTGDLGIPFALLDALPIPSPRREKLRRHFWRPQRFHQLLTDAQQSRPRPTKMRKNLLDVSNSLIEVEKLAAAQGEILGQRDVTEIVERARALAAEADMPPMPSEQAELIEAMLAVSADPATALAMMRDLCDGAGIRLDRAFDIFERRYGAIAATGVDVDALIFDAAFGRNLEYYDGFVFEITATGTTSGQAALPPLAGGGRYDAMTQHLGAPGLVPAVGGMIRPGVVASLAETLS